MKTVYLLVGRSGSGKSTVANILTERYGWKVLQSYTTRPPRFEGETGHTFVTKEEFDALEDKCAYTLFDGNEYCATSKQVDESDIYIIDPAGVEYFMKEYKGSKTPVCVIIDLPKEEAERRMASREGGAIEEAKRRIENDEVMFKDLKKIIVELDIDTIKFFGDALPAKFIALGIYKDSKERERLCEK